MDILSLETVFMSRITNLDIWIMLQWFFSVYRIGKKRRYLKNPAKIVVSKKQGHQVKI